MARKPKQLQEPQLFIRDPYTGGEGDGDYVDPYAETIGEYASLMRELGIDPAGPPIARWSYLAQALAEKYYPGFKKPVGRPQYKNDQYFASLLSHVEYVMQKQNLRSRRAALKYFYEKKPGLFFALLSAVPRPSFESMETDLKTAVSRARRKKG
jgi:hypothetical protein